MGRARVKIWEDQMGNIHGHPVREDLQTQIGAHMMEMTGSFDHRFFFQEGMGAEDCKEQNLSLRQKREMEAGWDVFIIIDPWELGHWYGWDTHTIFE